MDTDRVCGGPQGGHSDGKQRWRWVQCSGTALCYGRRRAFPGCTWHCQALLHPGADGQAEGTRPSAQSSGASSIACVCKGVKFFVPLTLTFFLITPYDTSPCLTSPQSTHIPPRSRLCGFFHKEPTSRNLFIGRSLAFQHDIKYVGICPLMYTVCDCDCSVCTGGLSTGGGSKGWSRQVPSINVCLRTEGIRTTGVARAEGCHADRAERHHRRSQCEGRDVD